MTKHKLTPLRQRRIVRLLAEGISIECAASLSGICERTYHNWIAKADRGEEPFASFRDAATRARNGWKARLIARIEAASVHDWRSAAFLLERQFPREFGPRQPKPEIIYVREPICATFEHNSETLLIKRWLEACEIAVERGEEEPPPHRGIWNVGNCQSLKPKRRC